MTDRPDRMQRAINWWRKSAGWMYLIIATMYSMVALTARDEFMRYWFTGCTALFVIFAAIAFYQARKIP